MMYKTYMNVSVDGSEQRNFITEKEKVLKGNELIMTLMIV